MDLSFLDREDVIKEFQDLVDPGSRRGGSEQEIPIDEDANIPVHKLNAMSLTITDVMQELERRGLQPKGFYSDDAKLLQRHFDQEHEDYVEQKRAEFRESKMSEMRERAERQKKARIECNINEEKEEVTKDVRLSEWLRLILAGECPMECSCRIDVTNVTARALAKVLSLDTRIPAVDLSHMNLSDEAGAYIGRALKNNKTLVKLELDGNRFGPLTCKSIAESLKENSTLRYLSLGSNALADGGSKSGEACIDLLAQSIGHNTALTSLSLWRCGIGLDGGKLLCDAITLNNSLISVEVGYNSFDTDDVFRMNKKLEMNRESWKVELAKEAELAKERERADHDELLGEASRQKEADTTRWLEEQKESRAASLRRKQEQDQHDARQAEERSRQMERARKMEEERVAAKSKKGKGKKKKKK